MGMTLSSGVVLTGGIQFYSEVVAANPLILAEIYNTTNTTANTGTFTVPAGYTQLTVFACGGGGSSGGAW